MDAYSRYLLARWRLQQLGYPAGSRKWRAYWEGHRARERGLPLEDCPYPQVSDDEKARGRRTTQLRQCWVEGWRSYY